MNARTSMDDGLEIRVGPPIVVVHADDQFIVSAPDARIDPERQQGFFVADTRLVSRYDVRINGASPTLLNSAAASAYGARYEFTNPELPTSDRIVPKHVIRLCIDRLVGQGVHEDYDVVNYDDTDVDLTLEIGVESDFADLFDVKAGTVVRRGSRDTRWTDNRLDTEYRNGTFRRGLRLQVVSPTTQPAYADGRIWFHIRLAPRETWHACVYWLPIFDDDDPPELEHKCHELVGSQSPRRRRLIEWRQGCTHFEASDEVVTSVVARATDDLADLRIHRHDADAANGENSAPWAIAAGIPWFVTLFGRDSLVVALQTLSVSPRFALGTLRALARLQGGVADDWRDLQPGKIEHEIRHGELAALRLIPQVPYYGTHDATTLYVLAVARSFRWHGDRRALDDLRPHVERALTWIDRFGDLDGDGLQEYQTRSIQGMYNQGWKDSGEAIIHADGTNAPLPIATCELQGYVVAAKRAWADIVDEVYQEHDAATRLRDAASRLAEELENRFWWEDEGTYYLGLDGDKRPIESVTSNPGHLLWSRAVVPERAALVATRLTADDMWTGWGVRTLSSTHHSYNPFSYQRGAVWPHDNAILIEGLCNYDHHDRAGHISRAIFDAANCFQGRRLPEVFSGLAREPGSFPVQYLGANVPQAWASGALIQILTAFLGFEPDAAAGKLHVSARLPEWLNSVRVSQLGIGEASVDLVVRLRDNGESEITVERGDDRVVVKAGRRDWTPRT